MEKPIGMWIEMALAEPGPAIEPLNAEVAIESCNLPGELHRGQ